MKIVNYLNEIINPLGAQLTRYPFNEIKRRMKLINYHKINKIFDIGASTGMYGLEMRKLKFEGEIFSFEPLESSYKKLVINSKKDKMWNTYNFAIGDYNKDSIINISGNYDSSSILPMLPRHVKGAPDSKYIGEQKIKICTLDSIFDSFYKKNDNVYVKVDTQGFENEVLMGAKNSLKLIKGMQIEMSLKPLYKGGLLYLEIIKKMNENHFELIGMENGFSDHKTGELLQVDGIFYKA